MYEKKIYILKHVRVFIKNPYNNISILCISVIFLVGVERGFEVWVVEWDDAFDPPHVRDVTRSVQVMSGGHVFLWDDAFDPPHVWGVC